MKQRKGFILILTLLLILFNLSLIVADGGFFPHPDYWVRPGQQNAIIFYEGNTETLFLTSEFQGNADDLVWIIPTPNLPQVEKASEEIFENIAELAVPKRDYAGTFGILKNVPEASGAGVVVVIETQKIDYYDVNVLVASDKDTLVKWFNENNYSYPEEYSYVLEYYINKNWFFTAIKISPESQGSSEVIKDLKEGHPTPIKMEFLSDQIVFPLKISSVEFPPKEYEQSSEIYYEYEDYIPIQIFVIADNKYEADNFYILYGNWVSKEQIENLGNDEQGNSLIQPLDERYFLTSLNAYYEKNEMEDDVYFEKSVDNKKINAGPEPWEVFVQSLIFILLLFLVWALSLGLFFIIGTLILFFSSNKKAKIIARILQIISLSLTVVILLLGFLLTLLVGSLGNIYCISFLITSLLLIGIMLFIIRIEKKRNK